MIIRPRIRGFICTTAHPIGCARYVQDQIDWISGQECITGPRKVLIIGASTGYGLASRITTTFGAGAATLGVFYEKAASGSRTATAGWYNSVAFEKFAREAGYYAESINGDGFSDQVKQQTIQKIQNDLNEVDLVIYSLAAPRRIHPHTEERFTAVLKPIGTPYTSKTVDVDTGEVSLTTLDPASEDEIRQTIGVMGGEDWEMWIKALGEANVLSQNILTVAYTYIGSELTRPIYRYGSIGKAKDHLEATVHRLNEYLEVYQGNAYISANKAVVTQSSSAIPVLPLYVSLLYRVMKDAKTHEGCIEQMYRLFGIHLYGDPSSVLDEKGRLRVDACEMEEDVQSLIASLWDQVTTENLEAISDISGYREEFLKLFGFGMPGINYDADVDPDIR